VALGTGGGPAGEGDRTGVAGVAVGAGADGAIVIGLADGMALFATGRHGGSALGGDKGMRRTLGSAGLILLAESDLLRTQTLFAVDGGPTGRSVAAVQELLIDGLVATAAVSGRELVLMTKP